MTGSQVVGLGGWEVVAGGCWRGRREFARRWRGVECVVVGVGLERLVRWLLMLAVVAGGRNEGHTGFRRCAAPEKKRGVRTEGNNSGDWGRMGVEILDRFVLTRTGKRL